VQNSFTAAYSM